MIENINWYPGHMKKTREMIQDNLKMVDAVIEVLDARIPDSSRNPILHEIIGEKKRIVILNKTDLADPSETIRWSQRFTREGSSVLGMNCMIGGGLNDLMSLLLAVQKNKNEGQILKKTLRLMIVGVPNVGKSSLINRLTGRKSTQVGDRPGVTRGKQWLTIQQDMQLLDTPGILWPKFEDPKAGLNLAFCGSIKDEVMDLPTLALELIRVLQEDYPKLLKARYKLEEVSEEALGTMEQISRNRGFILPGKRIDYERTARTVLDEFRSGQIGRITLEKADGDEKK